MPAPAVRPIRLIALMNQKGGVGKTTTTVNLAAAFARAGRPTLVVDLDPQAHASLHLGVDPAQDQPSVYDLLLDPAMDARQAIRQVSKNLAVIPAHTDMAAAESEIASAPDRFQRLQRSLASLGDTYEFILLDCPPSLGLLTINGLAAAREVLIPMQAHFLALQGVGKLLETVGLVTQNLNPRLRVSGVILCAHDPGTMHAREVVADLDGFFEKARADEVPWKFARVYRPAIRRNIKLAECPSFGQTIFDYAPDAPGAADYAALAKVLLTDWDAMLARLGEQAPAGAFAPAAVVIPTAAGAKA
ncbi:MAG: ParA family protein [Phycisphaerales bacterium]|nr:ParA family protein [Phycisphaerales bacterium]